MRKHLEVHFLPLMYQIMVLTFKMTITVTIMVKIICLRGLIGKHWTMRSKDVIRGIQEAQQGVSLNSWRKK